MQSACYTIFFRGGRSTLLLQTLNGFKTGLLQCGYQIMFARDFIVAEVLFDHYYIKEHHVYGLTGCTEQHCYYFPFLSGK